MGNDIANTEESMITAPPPAKEIPQKANEAIAENPIHILKAAEIKPAQETMATGMPPKAGTEGIKAPLPSGSPSGMPAAGRIHGTENGDPPEPAQEELSLMQQLEQREKAVLQKEIRFEAGGFLKAAGLPSDERTLSFICRDSIEETQEAVVALKEITDHVVQSVLSKKLIGHAPPHSSGNMSRMGSGHSSNMRDQVRSALS